MVLFNEIVQTNEVRIALNEADKAAGRVNKIKEFKRLEKYVTNTHDIIKTLEVPRVLEEYQKLANERYEKF